MGQVQGDNGPGVEREGPYVLGQVAGAAGGGVAAVGLGAVPGEEVLIAVEGATEGAPVVPVFVQRVDHIRFVMAPVAEFEEVFFCEPAGHVEFGFHGPLNIAFLRADEAH